MGSCASTLRAKSRRGSNDLKLPATRLRFNAEQLARLNLHLVKLEHEMRAGYDGDYRRDRSHGVVIGVVIERLVQRLICAAAILDARFSSKFLVTLDGVRDRNKTGRHEYDYLVRLDRLSSPAVSVDVVQPTCRVVEGVGGDGTPPGFAKVRVQGEGAEEWVEFVNLSGFLRRDKLQERFVELLALAAARAAAPQCPDEVDEAVMCGSPGKVVDVGVLHSILQLPTEEQVFYGSADCNQSRYPDPRDFRIAILETSPEIRLRVGFLSPSLAGEGDRQWRAGEDDAEVKLVLGIACEGWTTTADFPARVPLGHVDCMLYQQAAQTGFYLMPCAPHPTVRCDDRTATWQIWMPAAELALLTHYSTSSVPRRVLALAQNIVHELRGGGQEQLRVVSSYMLRTLLLFHLERTTLPGPGGAVLAWSPDTLAAHLVRLLDRLVAALRTQRHRSYFHAGLNVMLHSAAGGENHGEDEYLVDADIVEDFVRRLHEESTSPIPPDEDAVIQRYKTAEKVERTLLRKWADVLKDLAPPPTTRSRRMGFITSGPEVSYHSAAAAQYSPRQLDYIGHLFREMLTVRQLVVQNQNAPAWSPTPLPSNREDPVEDLIYLLTAILDQAKELTLRRPRLPQHGKPDPSLKLQSSFDASVLFLVDAVRKDTKTASADFGDDMVLVRQVLRWLYRALDEDRRNFGPVLRPYLNNLFAASHENCWHLDEWRKRQSLMKSPQGEKNELEALGGFCRIVLENKMTPNLAVQDAAAKKWIWAKSMMDITEYLNIKSKIFSLDIETSVSPGLQLLFIQHRVRREFVTFPLHLAVDDSRYPLYGTSKSYTKSSSGSERGDVANKRNTLRLPSVAAATVTQDELLRRLHKACYTSTSAAGAQHGLVAPPHCRLRDASPLTLAVDAQRRYGHHRGVGDVVQALVALNRFSILQEMSSLLPDEDRNQVLDAIQKLSRETRRVSAQRRLREASLPTTTTPAKKPTPFKRREEPTPQIYRPSNELAVTTNGPTPLQKEILADRERELEKELMKVKRESLLGTVRAARSLSSRPTVFAVVDAPMAHRYQASRTPHVALLELTEDRQLRLAPPPNPMTALHGRDGVFPKIGKKRDVVTKL